jgi:hypothetical protein
MAMPSEGIYKIEIECNGDFLDYETIREMS